MFFPFADSYWNKSYRIKKLSFVSLKPLLLNFSLKQQDIQHPGQPTRMEQREEATRISCGFWLKLRILSCFDCQVVKQKILGVLSG
jgi:hypothetical protein